MRRRKRKAKKREIDQELLNTIYTLQWEWKQMQSILENSIEPSVISINEQRLAQARYMFLLREARHRNLSAIEYK